MVINKLSTKPAQFISFEGTEGVGKSTMIEQLSQRLDSLEISYIHTREPGGSPFAEKLRELLLNPNTHIYDDTELLLMFSARSDHINQVILPALQQNKWVICDRFVDSTMAYQGFGRGFANPEALKKIHLLSELFIPKMPDITLWLDLPIKEGVNRAKKRQELDRFEQEAHDFFQRVHQGFRYLAEQNPNRIYRIDAKGTINEVFDKVWSVLNHKWQ